MHNCQPPLSTASNCAVCGWAEGRGRRRWLADLRDCRYESDRVLRVIPWSDNQSNPQSALLLLTRSCSNDVTRLMQQQTIYRPEEGGRQGTKRYSFFLVFENSQFFHSWVYYGWLHVPVWYFIYHEIQSFHKKLEIYSLILILLFIRMYDFSNDIHQRMIFFLISNFNIKDPSFSQHILYLLCISLVSSKEKRNIKRKEEKDNS